METINDAKYDTLRGLGFIGANPDMVLQWLQSFGATSNATPDAWSEMLDTFPVLGPAGSSTVDRWHRLLELGGYVGHINDAELEFWVEGAAVLLPTAVYNNFTIDSVGNDIGSPINSWNDTDPLETPLDFTENSGVPSCSLGISGGMRAIHFEDNGFIGPLAGQDFGAGFEGFFVIIANNVQTFQVIRSPFTTAVGTTFQVGIFDGDVFMRVDPLNDGNWITITVPILGSGLNVIYYRVDEANSSLQVLDNVGHREGTGVFPAQGSSYIRLGSDSAGANGYQGDIGEFWAYELIDLPNNRVLSIMESLLDKWRIRPYILLNETGHDFSGPGGTFVEWRPAVGSNGAVMIPREPILATDYEQALVNGVPAIRRVSGTTLINTTIDNINDNDWTIIFVFQNEAPNTGERYVMDGGRGSAAQQGRVGIHTTADGEGYLVRPIGGNVGPIPLETIGDQDLLTHITVLERFSAPHIDVRWDGQLAYSVEDMPSPPVIWRPMSIFGDFNGQRQFEGIVCEIMVFRPALTNPLERAGIEEFLMNKWGVIPASPLSVGYESDTNGLNFVNYDSGLQWHTGLDFEIVIEMVWDGSPVLSNDYVFRYGEGGEENLLFMNFGVGFAADGAIFYGHIAPNGNFIQTTTIPFGRANTVVTVRMAYDQSSLTIERGWTTEDGDSGQANNPITLSTREYADTNVMIFAETSGDTQAGFSVRNATMTLGTNQVINVVCDEGTGLVSINTGTGADGVISREQVHIGSPTFGIGYQSDDNGLNFVNYAAGTWDIDQDFELIVEMMWDGSQDGSNQYLFRHGQGGQGNQNNMNFGVGFNDSGNILMGMVAEDGVSLIGINIPFGRQNVVVTARIAYDATAQTLERGYTTEDGDSGNDDVPYVLTSRGYSNNNALIFASLPNNAGSGFAVRNATLSIAGVEVVNATCQEGTGLVSVNTGTGADGVISREQVHI